MIVDLERIDPEKNMARFYSLAVQPTLFGEWTVAIEWGRIRSPGQVRELWFSTEPDAQAVQTSRVEKKLRRGYRLRT